MPTSPSVADPLDQLDPGLQGAARWLRAGATALGWAPVVTSVLRGPIKQAWLYLTQEQACPPGRSAHELGLAFDMVVVQGKRSAQQQYLGYVWQQIGGAWSPRDPVHFTVGKVGCF